MRVSILKTDGGPHNFSKWAAATAGRIIEIASSAAGEQELEGRKLELKILDILEKYHNLNQQGERRKLKDKGTNALVHDFKIEHFNLDQAIQEIVEAGKSSLWASHFEEPGVIANIRESIAVDMATSLQIERLYYCDNNMNNEKAKAYKQHYHGKV